MCVCVPVEWPPQLRRSHMRKTQAYMRDKWLQERAEASFGAEASDYSIIFIPWGPKWNAKNISKTVRGMRGARSVITSVHPSAVVVAW